MNLSSFGDNHCQEDSWAKSAWRETRVFGGIALFFFLFLLITLYREDSWPLKEDPIKSYPILSLTNPNLILSLIDTMGPLAPNQCF
jgi:hypothetical protein